MSPEITDDLDACHTLRRTVFIEEQGFAEADEWDDKDAGAVHLLIRDGACPVAHARLMTEGPDGRIGRICVLASYRGKGLGADLVQFGIAHFREAGMARVVLGAQVQAQGFYEKLGFAPFDPIYDDGGVPHQEMALCL